MTTTPILPGNIHRARIIADCIAKTSPEAAQRYLDKAPLRAGIEDEAYRQWMGIERQDAA